MTPKVRQRPDAAAMAKLDQKRRFKDRVANHLIAGGGIFVLLAILAIFVYLLSESWPLFKPAQVNEAGKYSQMTGEANSSLVLLEEYNQQGLRLIQDPQGTRVEFFDTASGKAVNMAPLAIPADAQVVQVKQGSALEGLVALGLSNGQMIVFKPQFSATGVGKDRVVQGALDYPYGAQPISVNDSGERLQFFDFINDGDKINVVTVQNGQLQWQNFAPGVTSVAMDANTAGQDSATPSGGLDLDAVLGGNAAEPVASAAPVAAPVAESTGGLGLDSILADNGPADVTAEPQTAALASSPDIVTETIVDPAEGIVMPPGFAEGIDLDAALRDNPDYQLVRASSIQMGRSGGQVLPFDASQIQNVFIGQGSRWMYVLTHTGHVAVFQRGESGWSLYEQFKVDEHGKITAAAMLQGEISLLLGDEKGRITQWFMVRDPAQPEKQRLQAIRSFDLGTAPITVVQAESRRKGFLAGDQSGQIGYFYTTSNRVVDRKQAMSGPITALTLSSHSEGMLAQGAQGLAYYHVDAHHPDVSMSSLWGKVWYESYDKPQYVWQSTSGNADFESKMSLVPLTFGTIKAAFWAMLLAAPLAVAGAMYTAAFMSPALRTKVKPAIELMQALPTVILGFLAGLWLAPLVGKYLPAIFSLLVIVPIVILAVGFLWMQMPLERRNRIPAGIAPVVLIAPIVLAITLAFMLSQPLEQALFAKHGGSLVSWLRSEGIDYQAQNALIIGLIMGFAVIAPIFSISEDALFAVPRHLVNGSLALGATPWQTLTRVVLPTASPGIFSALMIGFGRAVGETMIVLMATGNTPIMDLSIFNGMRTLSANVAVEMGEAEVGSTHFRILFLSALVLFVMTFVLNTAAEVVRSRLRKKYGSL